MDFLLGPKAEAAGYRIEARDTVGSTNAEALAQARSGHEDRLWIVSDHQSAGRGRRGSQWGTQRGNLAASLYCCVDCPTGVAATLGFVAGLAIDEAVRRIFPCLAAPQSGAGEAGSTRLRLKWPNDLLLDGGKLAGILLEAEPTAGDRLAVVVGIGVNVVGTPDDLPYRATSLASLGGTVSAAEVFHVLSDAWVDFHRAWNDGVGFDRIREVWLDRAGGVGEETLVRLGDRTLHGVFESIDHAGRLVIRLADGTRHSVSAGDVHFGAAVAAGV